MRNSRALAASLGVVFLSAAACASPFLSTLPPWEPIPAADSSAVERVLILIGDAGDVTYETSPLLQRAAADVEAWSARLQRDTAVVVVYLGDNVYPEGVRNPTHPLYTQDSARLQAQVNAVAGPAARKFRSTAYFVAGNHDWGNMRDAPGIARLRNEADFLARSRRAGISTRLLPEPGTPGPAEVDVGGQLRLMFLDTSWWLFNYSRARTATMLFSVDTALSRAGSRTVMMFAHHPFQSGGSHGGLVPFWEGLGIRYLLARSGTVLQDLNSLPYRELHAGLEKIFARSSSPLAFVGGHDHSLQVIKSTEPGDPAYMLASGSASKLTAVGDAKGQLFRKASPGYMQVIQNRDGTFALFVMAAGIEYLRCDQPAIEVRQQCVAKGIADFAVVYSTQLKTPQ